MTIESKPNFRIIENYEPEVDYESFKEDFLNPFILKEELRKKHELSQKRYEKYRDMVLKETGLLKKPSATHKHNFKSVLSRKYGDAEFIREINGNYVVVKTTRYVTTYFGRYADLSTARMVRDKLIACDWDVGVGERLKTLYGIKRKTALDTARDVFDEFEDRYFNDSQTTIQNIIDDMGITQRVYQFLLMLLRDKYGDDLSRGMFK